MGSLPAFFSSGLTMKAGGRKTDKNHRSDSAHGTNPASATMAGYQVINIPFHEGRLCGFEALKAAVGEDTAGLMLTNPNTVGLLTKISWKLPALSMSPAACAIMTAPT